ncbi:MAG TPA: SDR family NAD(P)-dependent oxidoreductase [Dehalococcoidia bacterium]|nr:SDR family NAD(P)-dependent oxidoreductase [Dehalococcoidia bacterium]
MDFDGKVAVITGAASGIGRGMAEHAAREGMKVVLADVEQKALDAAVLEMRRQEFDVIGVLTDVSKPESVQALADKAFEAYGKVHLLHNNAGVSGGGPGLIWEQSLKTWQWVFGVNFWGVVHGLQAFMPRIIAQDEEAHVVNTASIMGLTPGGGIYGATKHAVVNLSETLYTQLRQMNAKVGVSVLCPGHVPTRITSSVRNRPDELWDDGPRPSEQELAQRDAFWAERGLASLTPAQVAEKVFAAIRADDFYILPHESDAGVRRRFEAILSRKGPEPLGAALEGILRPTS